MSNETALVIIEEAAKNGSLIFFDKNNGFSEVELYRTEISAITIDKDKDCFEINKKFMPKRETVDRIGEASGVIFTKGETRILTVEDPSCGKHSVYIGSAQGKVRMPDGTWRTSSICDYEFDPTVRAMLDYKVTELTAETKSKRKEWRDKDTQQSKSYGNTLAESILEYQKTARQRANTGARLRVIRELVGMPIALTGEQITKPVVFGRIVQNTSYILQTPEGRTLATAQALGVDVSAIFGGQKMLTGQQENNYEGGQGNTTSEPETPPPSNEPDFPDDPDVENTAAREVTLFEQLTQTLNEFLDGFGDVLDVETKNGKNPYKMIEEELDNPNATEESRGAMIKRIREWLKAKGIDV